MTTWTPQTKNTSSYSNLTKNSSTYSNTGKTMTNSFLLLEDGFYLLLEDGYKLILEDSVTSLTSWSNVAKS